MSYLEDYYNQYDEEGRLLSPHGKVEYLTTMKYIQACLSELREPTILEVGAGTGRYSVTLARQGYRVTAVELVAHNLEQLKAKLDGSEPITAMQGNALDLSAFPDASPPLPESRCWATPRAACPPSERQPHCIGRPRRAWCPTASSTSRA